MAATYYKNEVGRDVSFNTGIDWTGNTAKQIKVKRPDATTFTKTGASVLVDDAPTGQVRFQTASGDHNQVGEYLMQAQVTIGTTILLSRVELYIVEDAL